MNNELLRVITMFCRYFAFSQAVWLAWKFSFTHFCVACSTPFTLYTIASVAKAIYINFKKTLISCYRFCRKDHIVDRHDTITFPVDSKA